MADPWYKTSNYGPDINKKNEYSSLSISEDLKEIFLLICNKLNESRDEGTRISVSFPPDEVISDEEVVKSFLKEFKCIIYGTGEIFSHSLIQNKVIYSHLTKLLEIIHENHQHLIFQLIEEIFGSNITNKSITAQLFPLTFIVERLIKSNSKSSLLNSLECLASKFSRFNMTSQDLQIITRSLIDQSLEIDIRIVLLKILNSSSEKIDPNGFFHFSAECTTGLYIPTFPNFQENPEYTISTWFNIRDSPFELSKNEYLLKKDQAAFWHPYIFSFKNDEGISISFYVTANDVCYEISMGSKVSAFQFPFKVQSNKWHNVIISHIYIKEINNLRIFMDGKLIGTSDVSFPIMKMPFSFSLIGKSHKSSSSYQFIGSMGSFLVWNTIITAELAESYYSLGPHYQGLFHNIMEYNGFNPSATIIELFNGAYSDNIILAYSPLATSSNICFDVSHSKVSQTNKKHNGEFSKGLSTISTQSIDNLLFSYGNLTYFFFLVDRIIRDNSDPIDLFVELIIQLMEMIAGLISRGKMFCTAFYEAGGYNLLAWKLIKSGKACFTQKLMDCVIKSSKSLIKNDDLFKQLLTSFIFDLKIWKYWSLDILTSTTSLMISDSVKNHDYAFYIKKSIGLSPITDIIMAYYNKENLSEDLMNLKSFLFVLTKQIILQGSGIQQNEIDSALYYFGPKKEKYIHNLVSIMKEAAFKNKASFGKAFCNMNSILVFNELLSSPDPDLVDNGLEFFTLVVNNAPPHSLDKLTDDYHIWSILTYHLVNMKFNEKIFAYLIRMMVGESHYRAFIDRDHSGLAKITLNKPRVIQVFIWVLQSEFVNPEIDQDYKNQLYGFAKLMCSNLKLTMEINRENSSKLAKKVGWQGWILSLLQFFENTDSYDEMKKETMDIIKYTSYSSVVSNEDGWISMVDLVGYLHYFRTYKNFNSIYKLIKTEFDQCESVLCTFLKPSTSFTDLNPNEENSKSLSILTKKLKHQVGENIDKFTFNTFFFEVLDAIFGFMCQELKGIENLTPTLHDPSSNLLIKNISNISIFICDVMVNYLGSFKKITEFSQIPDSSTTPHLLHPRNSSQNCSLALSILHKFIELFDLIFIKSKVSFKKFEQIADTGEGSLIKLYTRLILVKIFMNVSTNTYRYWKVTSKYFDIRATPLNSMEKNLKEFFDEQIAEMEKNNQINNHPLNSSLLNPSDYKNAKEVVNRRGECASTQQSAATILVYALSKIMVSHYKRMLDYQHFKAEGYYLDYNIPNFVKSSLTGLGTLVYETLVNYSPNFNELLKGKDNKSLMDVGLKNMKTVFDPLEFVMLLTSDSWQNSFKTTLSFYFEDFCRESDSLCNIAISQAEKRSCMIADLVLYSALFVQYSVYSSSTWKRSLDRLNKLIQTKISEIETESLLVAIDNEKEIEYTKFLTYQNEFFIGMFNLEKIDSLDFKTIYRIIDYEDKFRRRFLVLKENSKQLTVKILDKNQVLSKQLAVINPTEIYDLSNSELSSQPASETLPEVSDTTNLRNRIGTLARPIENRLKNIFNKMIPVKGSTLNLSSNDISDSVQSFPCILVRFGFEVSGTFNLNSTAQYFEFIPKKVIESSFTARIFSLTNAKQTLVPFSSILRIFSRRFAHLNVALEIFLSRRNSYFFVFYDNQTIKNVVNLLPEVGIGSDYGVAPSRTASLASPAEIFSVSTYPQLWQKGEKKNFDYLMFLNTISGRSFHDISQYPVFPWILSNYESEKIDLADKKNYRDLSKPIGTLNVERLSKVIEKFISWNPEANTPPHHYEKHYSTPDIVSEFLIRLEPFTSIRAYMNGENLDNPLNIFNSISELWNKVTSNGDDIRELIPEMFYMPELFESSTTVFCANSNEDVVYNPVKLPPYANSAHSFVVLHSAALESAYVSKNLCKWIDLIFGFKQRGREAELSANVFNYLTYDSPINSLKINNISLKESIIANIQSCGQTPYQLLTTPHPARLIKNFDKSIDFLTAHDDTTFISSSMVSNGSPIIYISDATSIKIGQFITISKNLEDHKNKFTYKDILEPYPFQVNGITTIRKKKGEIGNIFRVIEDNNIELSENSFTVFPSENHIAAACHYWDNGFKIFDIDSRSLVQSINSHVDRVTCIDCSYDVLCSDTFYIVTGSKDNTICRWTCTFDGEKIEPPAYAAVDNSINLSLFMYGHNCEITHVSLNISCGYILSSSVSNFCAIHNIGGRLVSYFNPVESADEKIVKICMTSKAKAVILTSKKDFSKIHVYSNKGKLLVSKQVPEELNYCFVESLGNYILVSGTRNVIVVLKIDQLEVVYNYPPRKSAVTCLRTFVYPQALVVGLSSGELEIHSIVDWRN